MGNRNQLRGCASAECKHHHHVQGTCRRSGHVTSDCRKGGQSHSGECNPDYKDKNNKTDLANSYVANKDCVKDALKAYPILARWSAWKTDGGNGPGPKFETIPGLLLMGIPASKLGFCVEIVCARETDVLSFLQLRHRLQYLHELIHYRLLGIGADYAVGDYSIAVNYQVVG